MSIGKKLVMLIFVVSLFIGFSGDVNGQTCVGNGGFCVDLDPNACYLHPECEGRINPVTHEPQCRSSQEDQFSCGIPELASSATFCNLFNPYCNWDGGSGGGACVGVGGNCDDLTGELCVNHNDCQVDCTNFLEGTCLKEGYYGCWNIPKNSCNLYLGCSWDPEATPITIPCRLDQCSNSCLIDRPQYDSSTQAIGACTPPRTSRICTEKDHFECSSFNCGGADEFCTYQWDNVRNQKMWKWFGKDYVIGIGEDSFSGSCSDDIDNDCDGYVDEMDEDCGGPHVYDCKLTNVDADVSGCNGDGCGFDEIIKIKGNYEGSECDEVDHFQVDFVGGDCDVQYSGGDVSGIFGDPEWHQQINEVTADWVVLDELGQCEGERVTAIAAALWNGIPGVGEQVAVQSDPSGDFAFEGDASYDECGKYNDWVDKKVNHIKTQQCIDFFDDCVRDSDKNELYDQHCDSGNVKDIISYDKGGIR